MIKGNLFADIPVEIPDELFAVLHENEKVRIERIISRGQAKDFWYDQVDDEWVCLLSGSAVIEFDSGEKTELAKGDWLLLPAHCRHRVDWTTPDANSVWLAVHVKNNAEK
jgi:cupin 2 domain-containing protein